MIPRTDMASEAYSLWKSGAKDTSHLPGVLAREEELDGVSLTRVDILDDRGEKALCKPIGQYVTMELPEDIPGEAARLQAWCRIAGKEIRALAGEKKEFLVVGLGNPDITPDAIGPGAVEFVFATRHLREDPTMDKFGSVSVLKPGVLGDTGMESAELVRSAAQTVGADCILTLDALAAADPSRLCCTLQLTDTGIIPGSGVGNHRMALTKASMGVPVIAIGVPTVIDASAFSKGENQDYAGLFVSPRDMDLRARRISRLLGMSVNAAVHSHVDFNFLWELSRDA